jgi:hypothetical protein
MSVSTERERGHTGADPPYLNAKEPDRNIWRVYGPAEFLDVFFTNGSIQK